MTQSCCPTNSWPALKVDYTPVGKVEVIDGNDLKAYVVGPHDAKKAVIVVVDIFGFDGGRTRAVCDQLAEEGYLVVLPDIFRGKAFDKPISEFGATGPTWAKQFTHEVILKEINHSISFVHSKNVHAIGLMGFCYGVWACFVAGADPATAKHLKCAVDCHPSLQVESWIFSQSVEELVKKQHFSHLLLAAANDPDLVKEGGEAVKMLHAGHGKHSKAINFSQQHGWVPRGDVSDPAVKEGVEKALKEAQQFYQEHL